jgi:hypothetical protein
VDDVGLRPEPDHGLDHGSAQSDGCRRVLPAVSRRAERRFVGQLSGDPHDDDHDHGTTVDHDHVAYHHDDGTTYHDDDGASLDHHDDGSHNDDHDVTAVNDNDDDDANSADHHDNVTTTSDHHDHRSVDHASRHDHDDDVCRIGAGWKVPAPPSVVEWNFGVASQPGRRLTPPRRRLCFVRCLASGAAAK